MIYTIGFLRQMRVSLKNGASVAIVIPGCDFRLDRKVSSYTSVFLFSRNLAILRDVLAISVHVRMRV